MSEQSICRICDREDRRLGYIFLILGSIGVIKTSIDLYRANASTSWSSTGGIIVNSEVSESSGRAVARNY